MIKYFSILTVLFFVVIETKLHAQQKEFIYKNFTQEDGLPSNETYCVFEDSRHYLWIGTDNGVARYNGNHFEQFALPDNVVFLIHEDSKGRIWFFTQKCQLAYFENEQVHTFRHNDLLQQRFKSIHIKNAEIDSDGTIRLSTSLDSNYTIFPSGKIIAESNMLQTESNQTHFIITPQTNNTCFIQKKASRVISGDIINAEVNYENKKIKYKIACSPMHLNHFSGIITSRKEVIFFFGRVVVKLLPNGQSITSELSDPVISILNIDDKIWIGLKNGGVHILDADLRPDITYDILPGISVSSICKDYEEGIWISTLEKGLYYIRNRNIIHIAAKQLPQTNVSKLLPVNDSTILFANSSGLYSLTEKQLKLLLPYPNYDISQLLPDSKQNLYITGGTYKLIDIIDKNINSFFKNIFIINSPGEIILTRDNKIIAENSLEIYKGNNLFYSKTNLANLPSYVEKNILSKRAVIMQDRDENIWGGSSDGLYKSYPPYDTLLPVLTSYNILKKGISTIRQLHNGWLAAGVRSTGVALIHNDSIIAVITAKDGLPDTKIKYLLPFENQLWVATTRGISVINFLSYTPLVFSIKNIDKKSGLSDLNINQLVLHKNAVVVASSNGIYFINNARNFFEKKQVQLPFSVKKISYHLGDTNSIANITLPYRQNKIKIQYDAISYAAHDKIIYQYQLNNSNKWLSSTNTELIFESLEPGIYELKIRAALKDENNFSDTVHLTVTVEKPWWQNNWFRLFTFLSISLIVYLFIRRRIQKIKAEEKRKTELNAKLTELEQTALRSQMNPHFIFNCLTSIQQLIISGNKVDANEYLVKFSRLIRKTLDMSSRPFISVTEEKNYLEEYLLLEQLRLSGRFDFNIICDGTIDADSTFIPNMMIQPVVENCIRHGIKTLKNKKGMVSVLFEPGNKSITCTITDNGVGRGNTVQNNSFTEHKRYGMEIVRRRLETFSEFNVDRSGIEINDLYDKEQQPAGTEVILHLPYKNSI